MIFIILVLLNTEDNKHLIEVLIYYMPKDNNGKDASHVFLTETKLTVLGWLLDKSAPGALTEMERRQNR